MAGTALDGGRPVQGDLTTEWRVGGIKINVVGRDWDWENNVEASGEMVVQT